MRNLGLFMLAGGAAIAGWGFFMRPEDDLQHHIVDVDPDAVQIGREIVEHPGELNVTGAVTINTITPLYS